MPTALARCTECRKSGVPCLTPMGNVKDWASQTIDSHDEEIDRGKGCNERSDGGDEDGATAQR